MRPQSQPFTRTTATLTTALLALTTAAMSFASVKPAQARPTTPLLAYSAVDDAYRTCSNALAQYGVRVTRMLNSYSGKGGATVVLGGVNAGGVPVTAECTLTLPSRQLDIQYL